MEDFKIVGNSPTQMCKETENKNILILGRDWNVVFLDLI